jgi:hypothetical protein
VSDGDQPRPAGFAQRVLTLPPGTSRRYAEAEWVDAIVLVATGVIEVEGVGGSRQCFERGDLLWLTGLPVQALHNASDRPAVLVAVSRPVRAFLEAVDP